MGQDLCVRSTGVLRMSTVTSVRSYLAVMLSSEVNHIAQRQQLKARPEIAAAALVSEQNTAFQFNSGREVLRSQEHKETDALWSTLGGVSRKHRIIFNRRPEEERDQRENKSKGLVLQMP